MSSITARGNIVTLGREQAAPSTKGKAGEALRQISWMPPSKSRRRTLIITCHYSCVYVSRNALLLARCDAGISCDDLISASQVELVVVLRKISTTSNDASGPPRISILMPGAIACATREPGSHSSLSFFPASGLTFSFTLPFFQRVTILGCPIFAETARRAVGRKSASAPGPVLLCTPVTFAVVHFVPLSASPRRLSPTTLASTRSQVRLE